MAWKLKEIGFYGADGARVVSGARLPSGGNSCVVLLVDDDQPSPLAGRPAAVNVELAVCRHVAAEPD